MNAQPLNWLGMVTVAVWAGLLWWTIARPNSVLKFVGVTLLLGFAFVMAWNILVSGHRSN